MEIINKLVDKFPEEKHILKCVEECMELCEVLVKTLTKAEGMKPPQEKIVEEMGDLRFRMEVLARKLHIEQAVEARYKDKGAQLDEWYSGKYEKF